MASADDKPANPPAKPTAPTDLDLADLLRSRAMSMGGGSSTSSNDPKKYHDFNDLTQGAQKHEGLFTLYQKDEHLYAEIKPFQFEQPIYATAMIARGLARAGEPLTDPNDPMLLIFHRAGDKVQVIARNFFFKAPHWFADGKGCEAELYRLGVDGFADCESESWRWDERFD